MQRESGAPKADEIEVTPEMIEAGALVLAGFDTTFAGPEYWAEQTYLAMRRAATSSRSALDQVTAAARKDRQ
jgi:hypothetical protein